MKIACRKAFTEELLELAKKNKNIFAITSDARGSVTLKEFSQQLPAQFVEAGIAEQNMVSVAGGLAACGKIVFACAPAPFLSGRSYEQVKIDAVYNKRNVKLIGVSGGLSYGTLGFSHHALQDIAALRALPGLTVLIPSDGIQTKALTRILAATDGPVYMRTGRGAVNQIYEENEEFTIGKAKTVHEGSDLTLIAIGEMVWICIKAAKILHTRGIDARVLDMFSVKPLDTESIISAARETRRIMTFEEHSILGGLGGAVSEVTSQFCPVPVKIIGAPDEHIIAGESPQVYEYYGWTPEHIADTAEQWLQKLPL